MSNLSKNFLVLFIVLFTGFLFSKLLVAVYHVTIYLLEKNIFQDLVIDNTFLTIVSGVLVYIIGNIFHEFLLSPLKQHKEVIGKIDHLLNFYRSELLEFLTIKTSNEIKKLSPTSKEFQYSIRDLASLLISTYKTIPLKLILITLGIISSKKKIYRAEKYLMIIALSNPYFTRADLENMGFTKKEIKNWDKDTIDRNLEVVSGIKKDLQIHEPNINHDSLNY